MEEEDKAWWESQTEEYQKNPIQRGGGSGGASWDDKPRRFFFGKKERGQEHSKTIQFVDESFGETGKPFHIWEHQLEINGDWHNYFTCRRGIPDKGPDGKVIEHQGSGCPFCDAHKDGAEEARRRGDDKYRPRFAPYHAWVLTVVDTTEFTTKKGNTYKNMPRLFVMKDITNDKIMGEKKIRGSLDRWKVVAWRSADKKSANVGDNFSFIERIPQEQIVDWQDKPVSPYPYPKIFKPISWDEMNNIATQLKGKVTQQAADPTEQEVPF